MVSDPFLTAKSTEVHIENLDITVYYPMMFVLIIDRWLSLFYYCAMGSLQVVLSMGEMMYIPSYWFHYIVSQDASIQCNSRSGKDHAGAMDIENCGFR